MPRAISRTILPLLAALLTAVAAFPGTAKSQLIPVRTVPVATGDQFLLLPTRSLAMGGVTLALDDSIGDAWTNPARGVRVEEPLLLGSPTLYSISGDNGGGRSLPLAVLFRGRRWFGGGAFALQQIRNESQRSVLGAPVAAVGYGFPAERLRDASARNVYAQGFVGARLGEGPWSLGLGLAAADLNAMDGVDLLYASAQTVDQHGGVADVRLGLFRDGARDRLAFLLLHDRVSMTHEVGYFAVEWTPLGVPVPTSWTDVNHDRTRTWGAQIEWDRDLSVPGWRVGTSATVNRKSHPKIPNYDLQNLPRDPGVTWAYELGLGVSRTRGPTAFGVDLLVQPIWSDTWQEAGPPVLTYSGATIPTGGRTIENDFFFTNLAMRTGLSHVVGVATLRGGVELRSYAWKLHQRSYVEGTFRDDDEAWIEWSPSAGASLRLGDVEVAYVGRLTTGTGQPGVAVVFRDFPNAAGGSDFVVTPSAPLTLRDATVFTNQISVSVPIR